MEGMRSLLESFFERPRSQRIVIEIVIFTAVAIIGWLSLASSSMQDCALLQAEISRNDREILAEHSVAARIEGVRSALASHDERLKGLLRQLSDRSEVDDLLQSISHSAQVAGLELKLFQRKEEVLGAIYAEIPISVSVSGSFHDVVAFFDRVNQLPALVTIDQLSLSAPRLIQDGVVVSVDCTLTAHRLP